MLLRSCGCRAWSGCRRGTGGRARGLGRGHRRRARGSGRNVWSFAHRLLHDGRPAAGCGVRVRHRLWGRGSYRGMRSRGRGFGGPGSRRLGAGPVHVCHAAVTVLLGWSGVRRQLAYTCTRHLRRAAGGHSVRLACCSGLPRGVRVEARGRWRQTQRGRPLRRAGGPGSAPHDRWSRRRRGRNPMDGRKGLLGDGLRRWGGHVRRRATPHSRGAVPPRPPKGGLCRSAKVPWSGHP